MTPAATPWRRLVPLAAVVLAVHIFLLQAQPDGAMQPGKEVVRTFSTRTIAPAPPAPPPPQVAVAPQPAAAAPARSPRVRPPRPSPTVTASRDPAPEPPATRATDTESGGPALQPAEAPATPPSPPPSPPPAAPAAALPQVVALPTPARMRYEVTAHRYGIPLRGEADLNWRHDGHTYEVQLEVRSAFGSRTQRSSGKITDEGLAPDYFWEKTRNEQATHFERDKGRVTFSSNRPAAAIAPGMQDRLSVVVQLAVLVAGEPARFPAGTQIAIPTVSTREAETWIFSVKGEEDLDLPGGKVRALKIERKARKEFDVSVELWLAPRMDYAPVRVRLTNPNGDTVDQRWSSTDKG